MANPYLNAGIARGIESFSRNKDAEEERVRTLKEHTEDRARMLSEHAEDRAYLMEARGREKDMNEMQTASARQQTEGINALRAFVATGDPTPMADVFTKYGGGKVTFQREGDKYVVSGVRPDGTQYGDMPLTADEVAERFVSWFDPKGKILEDIKHRRELEKEAKKPRNKWHPAADGLILVNQESGETKPGIDPDTLARIKRKGSGSDGADVGTYNAARTILDRTFGIQTDQFGNPITELSPDKLRDYNSAIAIAGEAIRGGADPFAAATVAYDKIGRKYSDRQVYEDIVAQVQREAKQRRPAFAGMRPDATKQAYGGMSEEEWKKQRTQELLTENEVPAPTPAAQGLQPPAAPQAAVQPQPAQQPQQPQQPQQSQQDEMPPPEALAGLKEGVMRRFKNGQVWTIQNGQPVRVQ